MKTGPRTTFGNSGISSVDGKKSSFNEAKKIKEMVEVRSMSIGEMEQRKIIYPGMENRAVLNSFEKFVHAWLNYRIREILSL